MPEVITKEIIELGDKIVDGLKAVNKTLIAYELDKNGLAPVETSDVNFYDYDGSVVASYSAEDFLAMTGMPKNPTHEELESRGWNWSFEDAQNYVKKYGKLEVGQMYRWKDVGSATKITIDIPEEGRLTVPLCFQQDISEGVSVDWGDGSEVETFEGTGVIETSHPYAESGEYVISIDAAVDGVEIQFGDGDNENIFGNNLVSKFGGYITKIIIGDKITRIELNSFRNCCFNLDSLVISDSVTSIGTGAFYNCMMLKFLVIPDSVSRIDDSAFYTCASLQSLIIPDSITSIGHNTFYGCYALQSLAIPNSVTSIGSYAFHNGRSLTRLTIPDSIAAISECMLYVCYALQFLVIPDSVTSIGVNAFNNCLSLHSLVIPDSVKNIGESAFNNSKTLISLVLPDSITSISRQTFGSCHILRTLIIPESVSSIGETAFTNCYALRFLNLLPETPPTLTNANAFLSIPTDCVIYVPYSEDHSILNAYKTATNWSTYADMMVESDPE